MFNSDFGLATSKFIDLEEELRQKQFDKSLINNENIDNDSLNQLVECY